MSEARHMKKRRLSPTGRCQVGHVQQLEVHWHQAQQGHGHDTYNLASPNLESSEFHETTVTPTVVHSTQATQQSTQPVGIATAEVQHGQNDDDDDDDVPDEYKTVCFGEVIGLLGKWETNDASTSNAVGTSSFRARLRSADKFSAVGSDAVVGTIHPEFTHLTFALLEEHILELQLTCSRSPLQTLDARKRRLCGALALAQATPCTLSITIYGPLSMYDDIGDFFQKMDMYLQDPQECDRNVRYCNPHRLSSSSANLAACPWTFDLAAAKMQIQPIEVIPVDLQPDLLDSMDSHGKLDEAEQPVAIRTRLEKHQKQALTFMQQRELGWALQGKRLDIWQYAEMDWGHCFINNVSGAYTTEPPEQFYGGIIADPMGLGKTLTMIALIATEVAIHASSSTGASSPAGFGVEDDSSNPTLVVIPPTLLGTWEEQLTEHVAPGYMTWCRHHGKTRLSANVGYQATNIVLTTYNTVSMEWKSRSALNPSVLFTTRWRRIILDEAHLIRNSASQMAAAICALDATSRWAVTGTPIQNKLSDLAALLTFLRIHPYSDRKQFDADISRPWKGGDAQEAVKRLKRLAGCLILRRPKTTISLPPRRDLMYSVYFTPAERVIYDDIRDQVVARLDHLLSGTHEAAGPRGYVNVLQQIEAMRMVCNLGLRYHDRRTKTHPGAPIQEEQRGAWQDTAQQAFSLQLRMGDDVRCHKCNAIAEVVDENLLDDDLRPPIFFQLSLNPDSFEGESLEPGLLSDAPETLGTAPPSKVAALIAQLKALSLDTKCVVFSTWATTLDVVEVELRKTHIKSLRFDGKVRQQHRQGVIDQFRGDPTVQVLLLTLSCGAVGLTLTVASYAFLMDPHWNPTLEDQALARIHRFGQKREVTTIRFCMHDSFEQRILEIQESKRNLASVLVAPDDAAASPGLDLRSLQNLRRFL